MEEGWKQYRLIDILDTLIDYRGKTPRKTTSGIPLITAKIIKNGRIETPTEFIAIEDYDSWMVRGFPKVGDVVLTTEAPLGEVAQLDNEHVALAQRVVTLRGKSGVLDNTYLKYYLLSNVGQQRLKARETGTTVTGIKQSELREVLVDCPPYDIQIKIASILKSLDGKIEVNKRINDNLAISFLLLICFVLWLLKRLNDNLLQQTLALYKSWFVDFDPFKDGEFVESELGMIPKGWSIQKAQDVFEINIGKTPPRKEKEWFTESAENNIWVSIADMGNCGVFISDSSEYLTEEAIRKFNILMVEKDSVLLSFKLTIGRVAIADAKLTTNEAIARFILPDKSYREFLYLCLKQYEYGSLGSTSSIATAVNSKTIKGMKLLMPNADIIKSFSQKARPLFEQIRIKQQESRRLSQLRDALLPRLMSGELKVNEIEMP